VATGKVTDACFERHRYQEFLRFLKHVAKTYPRRQLHMVCDNYGTHMHPTVREWLAKHPRVQLHFTPASGSWLNLVEIFFGIITRRAIRRGTFTSVRDLVEAIRAFIDGWNDAANPSRGPSPPTRSWQGRNVKPIQKRDTSNLFTSGRLM
jgi:hypothetical protein